MAGGWDSGVSAPGGMSYAPPLMSFQNFSNWAADDPYQKTFNDQQVQLNQAKLQQMQQQMELSKAFASGLPKDAQGNVDYRQAAAILASKGDIGGAVNLLQSAPVAPPPIQGGGGQVAPASAGGAQPAPQAAAQSPASIPARPLPPPAQNAPRGDQTGSVIQRVTDELPSGSDKVGVVATNIARSVGVDPNVALTPEQAAAVDTRLQNYVKRNNIKPQGGIAPAQRIEGGAMSFAGLPPSANAGTPAPPSAASAQPQAAPAASQPQAPVPQEAAPQQGAPQQGAPTGAGAQGRPLVAPVELPPGFNDPVKAISSLRRAADQAAGNPKTSQYAQRYDAWADRIEKSITPMHVGNAIVDPQTGKDIYRGTSGGGQAGQLVQLENAERAARGERPMTAQEEISFIQGIRPPRSAPAMAVEAFRKDFQAKNGRPPSGEEIQDFQAAGVGKSTAERTKAAREENLNLILKAADAAIPAALEASRALPRGEYVPLNKLIQRGEIMSSDPRLVEFGMANLQLAEHWARAMNPTGVMRESDRDKALSFLDTAYGNNTYERAVKQLQKQITRERDAVRGGGTTLKDGKAPSPSEEGKTIEYVRGPDGKLGPAK